MEVEEGRERAEEETEPGGGGGAAVASLVVKSPAQRHPDLRLTAQRRWTVRRLKAELRRLHPDEPVSLSPAPPLPHADMMP